MSVGVSKILVPRPGPVIRLTSYPPVTQEAQPRPTWWFRPYLDVLKFADGVRPIDGAMLVCMAEQQKLFSRVIVFTSVPEIGSRTVLGTLVAPRVVLVDLPPNSNELPVDGDLHVSVAVADSGPHGLQVSVRGGQLLRVDQHVDASGALIFIELDQEVTAPTEQLEGIDAGSGRDALIQASVIHRRRADPSIIALPPGIEVPHQRSLFCELFGLGCPRG